MASGFFFAPSLEAPFAQLVQSRLVGPLHSSQAEEQRRHRPTEASPRKRKGVRSALLSALCLNSHGIRQGPRAS